MMRLGYDHLVYATGPLLIHIHELYLIACHEYHYFGWTNMRVGIKTFRARKASCNSKPSPAPKGDVLLENKLLLVSDRVNVCE
jgi:hypothetical protein